MLSVIRLAKEAARQALAAKAGGTVRSRRGLSKLSPEAIGKAINETEKQVNGIMLAFIGAAAFCVLSLLTPDSALLGSSEKLNVPLAGPVSFVGFIIIGPAVLVLLRAYLEIYIEHGKRLARIARLGPAKRDPTLLSSQNTFLRLAFTLILCLLLPLTLFMFAWKAAVFPDWGSGLLCVAIAATVMHLVISLRRLSWWSKAALSVGAGLISAGVIAVVGTPRRSFDLFRADLENQWLVGRDLTQANLRITNLKGAYLTRAHLERADLNEAHLERADLDGAHLERTDLKGAHLEGANLTRAHLEGADLVLAHLEGASLIRAHLEGARLVGAVLAGAHLYEAHLDDAGLLWARLGGADLRETHGLTQDQIESAYGDAATMLPPSLTRPADWSKPNDQKAPAPKSAD
jgi:uncharacterized protein YjbI with pentapeptide repeats